MYIRVLLAATAMFTLGHTTTIFVDESHPVVLRVNITDRQLNLLGYQEIIIPFPVGSTTTSAADLGVVRNACASLAQFFDYDIDDHSNATILIKDVITVLDGIDGFNSREELRMTATLTYTTGTSLEANDLAIVTSNAFYTSPSYLDAATRSDNDLVLIDAAYQQGVTQGKSVVANLLLAAQAPA